jgi:DNA-binding transcriptional ArsR family regulator
MIYETKLLLTKYEKEILKLLNESGILSFSNISKKTKIPRTSLYSHIKKLEERGLVSTEKTGRERKVKLKKFKSNEYKKQNDQAIILKEKDYQSIIYEILKLDPGERICWIQPSLALKKILSNIPISDVIDLNQKLVQSRCIVDGILEDNYYQVYKSLIKESDFTKAMKSLIGRPYEMHLSDDLSEEPNEIIIFPHAVFIFDWKNNEGAWSESEVIINLAKQYFKSLKNNSRKIDVSNLIRKLIEE